VVSNKNNTESNEQDNNIRQLRKSSINDKKTGLNSFIKRKKKKLNL
jgi:hypothetical protein